MATKKIPADVTTKTVTALVPVQYDNVSVEVGDSFDCREADLAQLLQVNAVEVVAPVTA